MADNREARRAARRRRAPLYVMDVVCRLGLLAVVPLRHAGHLSRTSAVALVVVLLAGLLISPVLFRRVADAAEPPEGEAGAYWRLRRYVRRNHPLLYGAEITCWLGFAAAAIWRLFTDSGGAWSAGLFAVSLAGVFVCFVLMVRRDPEGRL